MGKIRQRGRRQKRRLDHALRAQRKRHGREIAEARSVAQLREERRRQAEAKLARCTPWRVSELAARWLNRIGRVSDFSFAAALAPFVVAVSLRQAHVVDVVREVTFIGLVVNLFGAVVSTICWLFLRAATAREIVGDWMFLSAVGVGLTAYVVWPHIWFAAVVAVLVAACGMALMVWGASYREHLAEEARAA